LRRYWPHFAPSCFHSAYSLPGQGAPKYPAGLDYCVAVYRALLEERRPEEIVVTGASAGGNLAAALILRARDEGLPLPAGAILMTPKST